LSFGCNNQRNLIGFSIVLPESGKIIILPGKGSTAIPALPDLNKKYLSTDMWRREPSRKSYLSPADGTIGIYRGKERV